MGNSIEDMGRERKLSNGDAHAQLTHMLNEHGKKEELREALMTHLNESGWRDQLAVIEKVHEKGQDNVVIEDLVQDVAPKAASLVPDTARKELEKKVKKFLKEKQNGY